MGIKIVKKFIRRNIFSRPGRKMHEIKGLVVHWVAGPGATAMGVRNYFDSLADQDPDDDVDDRFAATQLCIGIEGEVVQCMPLDEMAYHVGAHKYTRKSFN
jgi:N-acetylmuramoyl-L-alanine amidase